MRCSDGQGVVQIGRMGAVAIAKAVAGCPKFERLELDENQISEYGVLHLEVRRPSTFSWSA